MATALSSRLRKASAARFPAAKAAQELQPAMSACFTSRWQPTTRRKRRQKHETLGGFLENSFEGHDLRGMRQGPGGAVKGGQVAATAAVRAVVETRGEEHGEVTAADVSGLKQTNHVGKGGVQEKLPDGSSWSFPSVRHREDFWLLVRHLMPLQPPNITPDLLSSLLRRSSLHFVCSPSLRLALQHSPPIDAPEEVFSEEGHLLRAAAGRMLQALPNDCCSAAVAAPQFGLPLKMILLPGASRKVSIVRWPPRSREEDVDVFLNPQLLLRSPLMTREMETCDSLPGVAVPVKRADQVVVCAKDTRGKSFIGILQGSAARGFLRAFDVCNGIIISDYAAPAKADVEPSDSSRLASSVALSLLLPPFLPLLSHSPSSPLPSPLLFPSCCAAYHEAGHALLASLMPIAKIEEASIQQGNCGPFVGRSEVVWRGDVTADRASSRVVQAMAVWLGGLAAEEFVFGRVDQWGGFQGRASFSDDLVNVAALATAFATRVRPLLMHFADLQQQSVEEVANLDPQDYCAPQTTGWNDEEFTLADVEIILQASKGAIYQRPLGLSTSALHESLVLAIVNIAFKVAQDTIATNAGILDVVAKHLIKNGKASEGYLVTVMRHASRL